MPEEEESEEHWVSVSKRLIRSSLEGDVLGVSEALADKDVDVNYKAPFNLCVKRTDSIQHEEAPDEAVFFTENFMTDVTPLFAAAHAGHIYIIKLLLKSGAAVNEKLFEGYATTAAAREGHHDIVGVLYNSGASQPAMEDALLKACLYNQIECIPTLLQSDMIRNDVLAQALTLATNRGLDKVVRALVQKGVGIDCWHRMLLRSAKPVLHANVNCTPLISAIIGRQVPVVKYLLEAGAKTGCKASLGAWTWELGSLEEDRVGGALASPYNELWCAVEYWEATGSILRELLNTFSPNDDHLGRTILSHAVLCGNVSAVETLLKAGADANEGILRTETGEELQPLLMAVKDKSFPIVKLLLAHGCDTNVVGGNGETGLMLAAKLGSEDCFEALVSAGADVGFRNTDGQSALTVAERSGNTAVVDIAIRNAFKAGHTVQSSNLQVFSQLHFVAAKGDFEVMDRLLRDRRNDINFQDQKGYTPLMIAAETGHVEIFKQLLYAGANINLKNQHGKAAMDLADRRGWLEQLESILLNAIMSNYLIVGSFKPLHFASRKGNLEVIQRLLKAGYAVDALDEDGYSPLMLAAKEGHADACRALLNARADCNLATAKGDTALSLARKSGYRAAEGAILDVQAFMFVRQGAQLLKHTREGKGAPHSKTVQAIRPRSLTWGRAPRQTVVCRQAALGASRTFTKNRKSDDARSPGLFRIVTDTGREVHFQAPSAAEADLWVRGVDMTIREAM